MDNYIPILHLRRLRFLTIKGPHGQPPEAGRSTLVLTGWYGDPSKRIIPFRLSPGLIQNQISTDVWGTSP
jgi:hypothetical protein